jgi:molybdopterin-guanine dinucleotide biosynthesis protein A
MVGCLILAGGRSRRFGRDKRRLRLWGATGPTLLEHTVALAAPLCAETIVVLNDPEAWPDLTARCVPDAYPDAGPLGGLVSGFQALQADTALVLAADLPLLQPALLAALIATPLSSDVRCLVRPPTGPEPLLAVYQHQCLGIGEALLERGERRMSAFLATLTREERGPDWWKRYDPEGRSFTNINRPDDLADMGGIP